MCSLGQYGIPKPCYFPFTCSYWCGRRSKAEADPGLLTDPNRNGKLVTLSAVTAS